MGHDDTGNVQRSFDVSTDMVHPAEGGGVASKCFDNDRRRLKRTGTLWTASEHIITALIGFGILWLAWATAQLGWIAGPPVMSFTYSTIGLGLGIAKVAENKKVKRSNTGIRVGLAISSADKVEQSYKALGDIAFVYLYSLILIEIQDTGLETKAMKKTTLISVAVTTLFYMLCGCFSYAAVGDMAPGNLFTGFGFYNPYWLVDIANAAIVIHLFGSYQVYCQPLFAFIENFAHRKFPNSKFITQEIEIPVPCLGRPYKLNLFRLVWWSVFMVITTVISMLLPSFNDVVGLLSVLGFWPLKVYFPIEKYIAQMKIPKWSSKWVSLQVLSVASLIIFISRGRRLDWGDRY